LAPVADGDLAFAYLGVGDLTVKGIPVTAVRVSYAGELGWELTASFDDGLALWDALMASGERYGVIAAGAAALSSMRIEKGYRMWGTDMTPEHTPAEAGLGFAVRSDGSDFFGRDGLAARAPATRRLATLTLEPDVVMTGGEPLFVGGQVAGYVTSAAYGPSVGRSIAYAWVPVDLQAGDAVVVRSFDREVQGTVAPGAALFDPAGVRLRA
jgi:glycine cleavage system aminomethyltransferase T